MGKLWEEQQQIYIWLLKSLLKRVVSVREMSVAREDGAEKTRVMARALLYHSFCKAVNMAGYIARFAMLRGVDLALSSDVTVAGDVVSASITIRLLRSQLGWRETVKFVRARARAVANFIAYLLRKLEEKGFKYDAKIIVADRCTIDTVSYVVEARATPIEVDAAVVLSHERRRQVYLRGSNTHVASERTAFIKHLIAEAVWEDERGGEDLAPEEAVGAAAEGGGEEELDLAGPPPLSHREALERGCVRLHEAVLRYFVPMHLLLKLVWSGKIRGYTGFDERGNPAFYVVEEDVREVARYFRREPEGFQLILL